MKTTVLNILGCGVLVIWTAACSDTSVDSPSKEPGATNNGISGAETYTQTAIVSKEEMEQPPAQAYYVVSKENAELQKRYDKLESDYTALQFKYEADHNKVEQGALRNRLFGEGVVGKDLRFGFVNSGNAKSVYEKFVNGVADNKDAYTREDWDEIKVLYEALDNRKNAIETEMSTSDNLAIARMKIRFASIKSWNRPGTKVDENQMAKIK